MNTSDQSDAPNEKPRPLDSLDNREDEFLGETIAFGFEENQSEIDSCAPVRKEYTLVEEIARGGMGRVFAAKDVDLEREVAVKVSTASESGKGSAFSREAKVLAHLAHPNIVPIHNLGEDPRGRPFYSMKLIRGRTLKAVIQQLKEGDASAGEEYTLDRLLIVFRKVCDAVGFAHYRRYLHRDLKPENVMLGEFGEVLVMDWGLAQSLESRPPETDSEGQSHVIEGTPQYMSPEQAKGKPLDARSDIYALGAMLHSILTYGPPVTGSSTAEVLLKGFTVRLAASERLARQNAILAQEHAERAEANAQRANEEKESSRRAAATAHMALAESAEKNVLGQEMKDTLSRVPEDLRGQPWAYVQRKLDTSIRTIQAPKNAPWRACVPDPQTPTALITLQNSGWIRSVDLSSGEIQDRIKVDASRLKDGIAVSEDGKRIAVCRSPNTPTPDEHMRVEIYSLENGGLQCSIKITASDPKNLISPQFAFSTDGNLLLLSSFFLGRKGVMMFDAWSGNTLWEAERDTRVFAGFNKEKETVTVCSLASGVSDYEPWTGKTINTFERAKLLGFRQLNVAAPSWSSIFSVVGAECRQMDAREGKTIMSFPLPSGISFDGAIDYLTDQKILLILADRYMKSGILQFLDAETGALIRSVFVPIDPTAESGPWILKALPRSNLVAAAAGTVMKVWKVQFARGDKTFPIDPDPKFDDFTLLSRKHLIATSLRFYVNPGSNLWTTQLGIADLKIRPSGDQLRHMFGLGKTGSSGSRAVITSDRRGDSLCATVLKDNTDKAIFKFIRFEGDQPLETEIEVSNPLYGHGHISPEGDLIWAGNAIHEASSGKMAVRINRNGILEPELRIRAPRWAGNERVVEIALLSQLEDRKGEKKPQSDRSLLLWSATDGRRMASAPAPYAIALTASPDGSFIAEAGSDMRVRIRDGNTLAVLKELRVHDDALLATAWHPKLPLLATASEDGTVKIWDIDNDTLVDEFGFFKYSCDRLFWSPDGTELAVRSRAALEGSIDIFKPASCQPQGK
ncbi:MAG: hypothetical protein EBS01_03330 [Verrucomicrobia bacterium]|nr:hypothetical protein [Verrucomicrobiota bacterium]